jgi:hypothetical protein
MKFPSIAKHNNEFRSKTISWSTNTHLNQYMFTTIQKGREKQLQKRTVKGKKWKEGKNCI